MRELAQKLAKFVAEFDENLRDELHYQKRKHQSTWGKIKRKLNLEPAQTHQPIQQATLPYHGDEIHHNPPPQPVEPVASAPQIQPEPEPEPPQRLEPEPPPIVEVNDHASYHYTPTTQRKVDKLKSITQWLDNLESEEEHHSPPRP